MCVKIVILILLGCCFVTFNKATEETLGSVDVTEENLEIQTGRVLAKLQNNHETIKNAFKFLDRKQRIVPNPIAFHSILQKTYREMSPHQIIPFEYANTNVGNGYDQHFGLFQAPVSGYYQFVLTNYAYPSSYYMVNLEIVRNGNMLCRAHAATYGQEGYCIAMVHLYKGDDVWVRHYNGEGRYLYSGNYIPSFSGHLIQAS